MAVGLRAGPWCSIMVRAGGLWHVVWSQHLTCCGVLLGLKNGWGCSGFSCEAGRKLRKQGVKEDVLDWEDRSYIITSITSWKRSRSKIENGLHLDEKKHEAVMFELQGGMHGFSGDVGK